MKKVKWTIGLLCLVVTICATIIAVSFANKTQYAKAEEPQFAFSKTVFKVSNNGDKLLLVTAIQNYECVYEMGYEFTVQDVETYVAETTKYYDTLTTSKTETATDIFGDGYDDAKLLVWEVQNVENLGFIPYAKIAEKDGDKLVKPEVEVKVSGTERKNAKYTVTFNEDNGTDSKEIIYYYGEMPTYETTPAKTAEEVGYTYTFKGWDKEFAPVTEDVTYTAQYEKTANIYTITFKNGEETVEAVQYTVENGLEKSAPAVPAKTGYTGVWGEYDFTKLENQTVQVQYTVNTYTVTLNNVEEATCDTLESYTYGIGATLPVPTREGFVFGGWYDGTTRVTAITTTDIENKTFTAKWLVEEVNKVVVKTAEEVKASATVDGFKFDAVNDAWGVSAWYHDSDQSNSFDLLYAKFVQYSFVKDTGTITLPGIDTIGYDKIEFGVTFCGNENGVTSVKINGNEYTIQTHSVFVVKGDKIYVYKVNAYGNLLHTFDYDGGNIVLEFTKNIDKKEVYISEMHGLSNLCDYVEKVKTADTEIDTWLKEKGSDTGLTAEQKVEAFELLNTFYVDYQKYINYYTNYEKTANPLKALDTLKTLAPDYFVALKGTAYETGANTYLEKNQTWSCIVHNGAYHAPYAPPKVEEGGQEVEKISCVSFTNGNLGGQVMSITLPKINFKALDCAVSINIGQRNMNENQGHIYVNDNQLGTLMQGNQWQGVLSITKDANGNYVLRHHIGNGDGDPKFTLTEEEATGQKALTITMDLGTARQWWGVLVSDMYLKFN